MPPTLLCCPVPTLVLSEFLMMGGGITLSPAHTKYNTTELHSTPLVIFSFLWYWHLNSGPCPCWASTLTLESCLLPYFLCVCACVCVLLGLELRAFTLSHSTSPFFYDFFFFFFFLRYSLSNYLRGLASNLGLPALCLLSS
jgi:hypothetical protein